MNPPADNAAGHRVLFLADHLGFPGGSVHGVTTYLLDVLPALQAAGIAVGACFLRTPHPAAAALQSKKIPVAFIGSRRFNPFAFRQVSDIIRDGDYRILHCTQFGASMLGRALARSRPGLKVILHLHDLTMPPLPVRVMNRVLSRRTDSGICVSEAARSVAVSGYFLSPDRVKVLHTGIDTRDFAPLHAAERANVRAELGVEPDAPLLCHAGRFHPVKGHRELLRMFAEILKANPGCMLLLAGDGPDRQDCEDLVDTLQLANNVEFLGERSDVSCLMGAADVFVLPSKSEGLPRVVVEANLCGVPVVAYDCGGVAEAMPDPVCGELVPPGDTGGFVAAVNRALRDSRNDDLASRRNAIAHDHFGLAQHARKIEACYDMLQGRPA